MKKKLALFLAMVMLLACMPMQVFASATAVTTGDVPVLTIESTYAAPGQEVEISVDIAKNPGIYGAILTFSFPQELTLISVTKGVAFGNLDVSLPDSLSSPYTIFCDGFDAPATADGNILTFRFKVAESAMNKTLWIDANYIEGDIVDSEFKDLDLDIVKGELTVIDYLPGDVNGDGRINTIDVTWIRRYRMGGYELDKFDERAANVNGDYRINTVDVTWIRRYRMNWPGVELLPAPIVCEHVNMEAKEANAPTCTENGNDAYWYCPECGKTFSDENGNTEISVEDTVIIAQGHIEVEIPAVAPTYDKAGSTAGVKCLVCGLELVSPKPIGPITPDEVFITYRYETIAGDGYLPQAVSKAIIDGKLVTQETQNVTEAAYTDLPWVDNHTIEGYEFQGWYNSTAADAVKVTEIAKGAKGNVTLYARWAKTPYTVTMKAPLKSQPAISRTIDQVTLLPTTTDMVVPNYYFMGWSDASGRIIDQIEPGVGNVTVYANWTSATRNIAYAADYKTQGPIIMEENGQYLFVYNVGYIDRVPIQSIEKRPIYNSGTYKHTLEAFESVTMEEGNEKEINSVVANATTHSSSWTLSEEWNELITEVNGTETGMEQGKVVAISDGSSTAYSSSASNYSGSSFHASNDSFISSKTITDDSNKVSASVGAEVGYGPAKVSATVSGETAHSEHQEDYAESKSSMGVSGEWNQSSSYSASGESFTSTTQTQSILESAKNTWNLEISKALTDTQSRTDEESIASTTSEGYKSIIAFHNASTKGNTTTIERTFTDVGYYRYTLFAKVHVFAVVRYDMATGAYYVNTYSVVDDTTFYDFDFSSDSSFTDYNNAVLPFEVPISVYDYIFANNAMTEGVDIDRNGVVKAYNGDATNVRIPDYATFNNDDGTYKVVPVTAIEEGLFMNKTDIKSVRLGKYIHSIPANAFNGCSSLEKLEYNSADLVSIGDNAFNGCVSLNSFTIGNANQCKVTSIGTDAFKNAPNVVVYATNADVVEKAVSCGAEKVSVYMKHLTDAEVAKLSGKMLKTAGTTITGFALYGADKIYRDLSVESGAASTVINGMTFKENTKTPLVLNSANVELNRVNIENAPGIAMHFVADSTNVTVKSVNDITTDGTIAILSKGLTMARGTGEYPELNVAGGDIVVCGEIEALQNFGYLNLTDGVIRSIDTTEYDNLLNTHLLIFDANEGVVSVESKEVRYQAAYGELPVPTRDYYTFDGWYTAAEGGEKVNADTVMLQTEDVTLYAHWVLKAASGWVKASEVPEGAQVLDEYWAYTLTEETTSTNSDLAGWTRQPEKDTWKQVGDTKTHYYGSYPGGFDTSHSLYSKYAKSALSSYEKESIKRVVSGSSFSTYIYWHWNYTDCGNISAYNRQINDAYTSKYNHFAAFASTTAYGQTDRNGNKANEYYCDRGVEWDISWWWFRFTIYSQTYTDYQKLYSFKRITQHTSETKVTASNTISNVEHYVQYRAK